MNYVKAKSIMNKIFYAGCTVTVAAMIIYAFSFSIVFFILGICGLLIMTISMIFGFINMRCPRCYVFLSFGNKNKNYCSDCGESLTWL